MDQGHQTTLFYAVAFFAVFVVAVAKAGFGGMIGSVAMPMVAALSDTVIAIAILLPTYVLMDLAVAWIYRRSVRWDVAGPMILAGLAGVVLGGLLFRAINAEWLGLGLGLLAVWSALRFARRRRSGRDAEIPATDPDRRRILALAGGAGGSGLLSYFLMAEAPVQMYILPLRLAPDVYAAVLVWFFMAVNWAKMPILLGMGVIRSDTLWLSALLLPVIPPGIWVGRWINAHLPKDPFYSLAHGLLFLLGLYLIASSILNLKTGDLS